MRGARRGARRVVEGPGGSGLLVGLGWFWVGCFSGVCDVCGIFGQVGGGTGTELRGFFFAPHHHHHHHG